MTEENFIFFCIQGPFFVSEASPFIFLSLGGCLAKAGAVGYNRRIKLHKGGLAVAGTLYLVATPIGNLDDMPPRVAATFGAVDFVAAEDTRVTLRLLNHLGLKKR